MPPHRTAVVGANSLEHKERYDIVTDQVLRKASAARVDRRLRRYYLIVRLLPNVFCSSLSSFEFDIV